MGLRWSRNGVVDVTEMLFRFALVGFSCHFGILLGSFMKSVEGVEVVDINTYMPRYNLP
jgi:hypothetical protein